MIKKPDMLEVERKAIESIKDFRLPDYMMIPNVGLYLNQVVKYISDCMAPIGKIGLTSAMVSNYVKEGLIAPPVRKLYYREQIAYLMFISLAKGVLTMEEIHSVKQCQELTFDIESAYRQFNEEMTNALRHISDPEHYAAYELRGKTQTSLVHNIMPTVTYKMFLDKFISIYDEEVHKQEEKQNGS